MRARLLLSLSLLFPYFSFLPVVRLGLKEALLLWTVTDEHVLSLLVMIQHHFVVFTPKTRLFVAAECGVSGIQVITVDPNAAGPNLPSEAIATVCVAAPSSRPQSVSRVIGDGESLVLVAERSYGQNRSKDFLLKDPHFIIAAEYGRLDIVTIRKISRQGGSLAASKQFSAFLLSNLDVLQNLLLLF